MAKKYIKYSVICVLICFIVVTIWLGVYSVNAEERGSLKATTLEDKCAEYTSTINLKGKNSDKTIFDYQQYLEARFEFNNLQNLNTNVYDEWLFQIVPQELFDQKVQKYLYIGKEYGFFVDYDSSNNKVLVYLIAHSFKDNGTGKLVRQIRPIYYEQYIYDSQTKSATLEYITKTISGGGHTYINKFYQKYSAVKKLYLKDVSFTGTLYNENHLNENEPQYRVLEDKGAFFVGNYYKFNGVSTQSGKLDYLATLFRTAVGYVSGSYFKTIGVALSVKDFVKASQNFLQGGVKDFRESISNENCYGVRINEVVPEKSGKLPKTSGSVLETDNNENAIMFAINSDNFVENTFYYNYRDHINKWNSRFVGSISLDIVEEEVGATKSSVKNVASDVSCVNDFNYMLDNDEKKEIKRNENHNLYILNDAKNNLQFTALEFGNYEISTFGVVPNKILCDEGNIEKLDDKINCKLTVNLKCGDKIDFAVAKENFAGSAFVGVIVRFVPEKINFGDSKKATIKKGETKYYLFDASDQLQAFNFDLNSTGEVQLIMEKEYGDQQNFYWPKGNSLQGSVIAQKGISFVGIENTSADDVMIDFVLSNVQTIKSGQTVQQDVLFKNVYLFESEYSTYLKLDLQTENSFEYKIFDENYNLIAKGLSTQNPTTIKFVKNNVKYFVSIENATQFNVPINMSVTLAYSPSELSLGKNTVDDGLQKSLYTYTPEFDADYKISSNCAFVIYDGQNLFDIQQNTLFLHKNRTYNFVIEQEVQGAYIDISLVSTQNLQGKISQSGVVCIEYVASESGYYMVEGVENYAWYNEKGKHCSGDLKKDNKYYLVFEGQANTDYSVVIENREKEVGKIQLNIARQVSNGVYCFEITQEGAYTFRTYPTDGIITTIDIYDNENNYICKQVNVDSVAQTFELNKGIYYINFNITPQTGTVDFKISKQR